MESDLTTRQRIRSNLRFIRVRYRYTQMQMADIAKVKRCTYASWEEGRATPGYDHMIAFSEAFMLTLEQLIRKELKEIIETIYKK